MVDIVLAQADSGLSASLERLFKLLRIKSISTDGAYAEDCAEAAEWCADTLRSIGFDAAVRPASGHPMVVGHGGPKNAPLHVLFYGHYDVQPVDPLNLWEHPPFEPHLAKGAAGQDIIVARGACDDKGQLMTFVEACRAYRDAGRELPLRVTVLLEGEEECGSSGLEDFLHANRDELASDVVLVCDTEMWNAQTPAITSMLRGALLEEVFVDAANRDLHSGMYGGAARNPIRVLARIIADLHDDGGRITIPGFYDGVEEPTTDERALWDGLGFNEAKFLGGVGLSVPAGEKGRSVLEQVWSRPTCDVNGIVGGYIGEGSKTVIPATASAKISFRLVGKQDPEAISRNFRRFVEARLPADCKARFLRHGADPAVGFALQGPYFEAARAALSAEFGCETALVGCGGSIPIVRTFKVSFGMDSLLVGFGLDDDKVHSPNEKYNLSSFHHGIRSWVRIIDKLGEITV